MTRVLESPAVARQVTSLRCVDGGDPDDLLRRTLDLVAEVSQTALVGWYQSALLGEGMIAVAGGFRSQPRVFDSLHELADRGRLDFRRSGRQATRRFMNMRETVRDLGVDWATYERSEIRRVCFEPFGIHDQARLLVADGPRLVAWIGALRSPGEPAFARPECRALTRLAEPIASAVACAGRLRRVAQPETACDVLVDPRGRIEYRSAHARAWTAHEHVRAEIRRMIEAIERGERHRGLIDGLWVRWSRLEGPVSPTPRYLLHIEVPELPRLHPTFGLSPRQHDVAESLAAGATIAETARHLGISVETTRTHLREAYRRLEVASRAELVAALRGCKETGAPTLP